MKLDLFQRAVLYTLAWFLHNGDQRFKTRGSYALGTILYAAARSGELNGNIDDAVQAKVREIIQDDVKRIQGPG